MCNAVIQLEVSYRLSLLRWAAAQLGRLRGLAARGLLGRGGPAAARGHRVPVVHLGPPAERQAPPRQVATAEVRSCRNAQSRLH